jgi:tRNA(fMet)-specific endonuclease VapC
MYLLDTNHCSRIIAGDPLVLQNILTRRNEGVAINVIVQGELLFMAENSDLKAENRPRVQSFLSMQNPHSIDRL